MSTPSDSGESSKPQKLKRPVSLLTPEQLKQKRALDRESQRQTRLRARQTVTNLQQKVESLTKELEECKFEIATLKSDQTLATIRPLHSTILEVTESSGSGAETPLLDLAVRDKIPSTWGGIQTFHDSFFLDSEISTSDPTTTGLLDPSLLSHAGFPYHDAPPPSLSIQVWEARPCQHPPTCRLDKVLIDIVESRKMLDAFGGNRVEFGDKKFPSVAALLNPRVQEGGHPLTCAVVSDVIHGLAVLALPEQIAVMYIICTLLRWEITGTKENYDAMPPWLRPGASQIVTAHPAWVDTFPWPKARDRICQSSHYHTSLHYETFKIVCNRSISINWPYEPGDALLQVGGYDKGNGRGEYVINPVFLSHIRRLENWTLGKEFVELFPEFEGDVNVAKES
ncbi:hypothetical protein B0J14DRAFT_30197 [Halenospora varia]|nr:hypothetical protein B0J14DRAFT_30197 [Halenospora varia]